MHSGSGTPNAEKKDGSTRIEVDGSTEADEWYAIWLDQFEEDLERDFLNEVGGMMDEVQLDENGECEHGGDGVTCPPCVNRRRGTVIPEPVKVSYLFVAKFDSTCSECNLPLSRGSWSKMLTDGRAIHYECESS